MTSPLGSESHSGSSQHLAGGASRQGSRLISAALSSSIPPAFIHLSLEPTPLYRRRVWAAAWLLTRRIASSSGRPGGSCFPPPPTPPPPHPPGSASASYQGLRIPESVSATPDRADGAMCRSPAPPPADTRRPTRTAHREERPSPTEHLRAALAAGARARVRDIAVLFFFPSSSLRAKITFSREASASPQRPPVSLMCEGRKKKKNVKLAGKPRRS